MKKLLLIVSIALPAFSFAQSKEGTEPTMKKFVQYHNAGQSVDIRALFADRLEGKLGELWTPAATQKLLTRYGKIEHIKYLGIDEGVEIYLSVFETGLHAIGITVDAKGELETFRFVTSSPSIDKMVANAKL